MRALGARHNLATPSRAFITDVFSTSYTASVDALVVTPRWLDDLKSDPDGAAAVVLHEIAHRQETRRLSRYLVTLTFGAWPVLFVIAAFYDIASLKANAPVSSSITYLAAAMAATTLAYGLGFLARSWASRALELRADAAAADAGYASALIRRLGSPPATPGESGTLAPLHQLIYNLTSAHPGPAKRIRVLTLSVDQRDLALPLLGLRPHPASDVPDPLGTI
jgi:Zn-dependent protease with chaperone function